MVQKCTVLSLRYLHLWYIGVKSYPRGVTTNSDGGIESYEAYYPVFQAMQEVGMVLNLHGEIPSDSDSVSNYHQIYIRLCTDCYFI